MIRGSKDALVVFLAMVGTVSCGDRAAWREVESKAFGSNPPSEDATPETPTDGSPNPETPTGGNPDGDNPDGGNTPSPTPTPTGGNPNSPGGDVEPPPSGRTEQEISELCNNPQKVRYFQQEFYFPDPGHACYWDYYDNLTKQTDVIRARTEQFQLLKLHPDAIICKMDFDFKNQKLWYDDEFLLMFNSVVLTSSANYNQRLTQRNGLSFYSWKNLANTMYSKTASQPYCLGADTGLGSCMIPETELLGDFNLQFEEQVFTRISAYSQPANDCRGFTLVTTGDDDPTDCRHTDFRFNVNVKYVMP